MTSESTPEDPARAALPTSRSQPAMLPAGGAVVASWLHSPNVSVLREVALLPVLALLLIYGTVKSPVFLTVSNFSGIGEQVSALGVVVVGEGEVRRALCAAHVTVQVAIERVAGVHVFLDRFEAVPFAKIVRRA